MKNNVARYVAKADRRLKKKQRRFRIKQKERREFFITIKKQGSYSD
jgi:hypothetical protein